MTRAAWVHKNREPILPISIPVFAGMRVIIGIGWLLDSINYRESGDWAELKDGNQEKRAACKGPMRPIK